jgi:hypothetical protein
MNLSWGELWREANSHDMHPPGMYALSRFFCRLTGSERWLTLGPLAFAYTGLFVFVLRVGPTLHGGRSRQVLLAGLTFFHPLLLMWTNSIRWYPYWSGLALITLSLALLPPRSARDGGAVVLQPPRASWCMGLGALTGCMMYLNYITLVFLAALLLAWIFRYPVSRCLFKRFSLLAVTAGIVALPQIRPMVLIHLPMGTGYHRANLLASAARMAHGLFIGDAILPWHPIAPIMFLLVVVPSCVTLFVITMRYFRRIGAFRTFISTEKPLFVSLLVFCTCVFFIGAFTRVGIKPRSFLLLVPLWTYLLTLALCHRPTGALRKVMLIIIVLWLGTGAANLATKSNTSRGQVNDNREEVVRFIAEQAGSGKAVIFAHDAGIIYAINQYRLSHQAHWELCALRWDNIHELPPGTITDPSGVESVFVVDTYVVIVRGSTGHTRITNPMDAAKSAIADPRVARLGPDKHVAFKRMVRGLGIDTSNMPAYRFVVTYGPPRPDVMWSDLAAAFSP